MHLLFKERHFIAVSRWLPTRPRSFFTAAKRQPILQRSVRILLWSVYFAHWHWNWFSHFAGRQQLQLPPGHTTAQRKTWAVCPRTSFFAQFLLDSSFAMRRSLCFCRPGTKTYCSSRISCSCVIFQRLYACNTTKIFTGYRKFVASCIFHRNDICRLSRMDSRIRYDRITIPHPLLHPLSLVCKDS